RDGAVDFLEKPFAPEEILSALDRAFAIPRPRAAPTHVAPQLLEAYAKLSSREREVFAEVISGESNKEIARRLELSPRTVETHRRNIMAKTHAKSVADLVRMAVALGVKV
ncbi:MAG: response regulator transcription factor, partial [Amphiplicatus sp.]